jgi:ribonuclease HI
MDKKNILEIFTDGASSGNPGPGWAMWTIKMNPAEILRGNNKQETINKRIKLIHCTNNEAEYLALIYALKDLLAHPQYLNGYQQISFNLDSKLVVEQVNGRWKIKEPRMRDFVVQINLLLPQFKLPVEIKHIHREKNLADKLKY